METEKPASPPFRNIEAHAAVQTRSIPEEIIEEILYRLPVKSLLRFNCVSKSLRCLIGSKRFIKTHLEYSTKNASFAHHRIILSSSSNYILKQCSLPSLLNEPFTDPFTLDDSTNFVRQPICLVGCCDGLVCILLQKGDFMLWNPSTRMSKKLPDIHDKVKHGYISKYGFGYDESSGDYKAFGTKYMHQENGQSQALCKLYSLKTNSWKIVEDRYVTPICAKGYFACGKLHWLRIFGSGIISFDLKSEVYGMFELPSYLEGGFGQSLGVLGGCLCVLCDDRKTQIDVWVMKECGMKESWDKVATVPYLRDCCPCLSTPFAIGPNGEILLSNGFTLLIYPKDNVFRHPRIINLGSLHHADIYIESLVSVISEG